MMTPKIIIAEKVSASTVGSTTTYRLSIFVKSISMIDSDTGLVSGDFTGIPLELFLYSKRNSSLLNETAEYIENSKFRRVLDPEDLATEGSRFGNERLIWALPSAARQSSSITLQPATSENGAPVSQDNASKALAPLQTGNSGGYYKSRLFVFETTSSSDVQIRLQRMRNMLSVFVQKWVHQATMYDASTGVSFVTEETIG